MKMYMHYCSNCHNILQIGIGDWLKYSLLTGIYMHGLIVNAKTYGWSTGNVKGFGY